MIVAFNVSDIHAYCIKSSFSKIRLGRLNVKPFSIYVQQLSCILYGLVKYYVCFTVELNQEKVSFTDKKRYQTCTYFSQRGSFGVVELD